MKLQLASAYYIDEKCHAPRQVGRRAGSYTLRADGRRCISCSVTVSRLRFRAMLLRQPVYWLRPAIYIMPLLPMAGSAGLRPTSSRMAVFIDAIMMTLGKNSFAAVTISAQDEPYTLDISPRA